MAIVQISRIQHRRGLQQDLPQLASAELGWSVDQRRLFIGNGTVEEGAPATGVTEILTEYSDILSLSATYTFKGLSAGFQVVTGPDSLHPIVRTLQDKLDDYVSVKDFGAVGDGATDDTEAINRALSRVYASGQSVLLTYHHRTIYFPAGKYVVSGTINIPPYTRIQGEGKRTTIIEGTMAAPIAQFVDGNGSSGIDYGSTVAGIVPEIAEYHFSDISFIHNSPLFNQSCLVIDGGITATFNRCMFRGATSSASGDFGGLSGTQESPSANDLLKPIYNINRGTGIAAVCINNNSATADVKNVVFNQCDFMDHNYGVELNNAIKGVAFSGCFFDHCYHHIVAGNNSPDPAYYIPYGISIYDNYFRYSALESVKCFPYVNNIMSLGNMFTAAGLSDYSSNSPIINPDGLATSPAITFNDNNNFSIADSFDRADADYALFPNIETNGYDCYLVAQDRGVVNGKLTEGRGHTITLPDSGTMTTAGVTYIPTNYTNLTMHYTLSHINQQRVGTLNITRVGGTFVWSEDYTETGPTGVVFQANTSTGEIEYTSITSGTAANLTYNLRYFTV